MIETCAAECPEQRNLCGSLLNCELHRQFRIRLVFLDGNGDCTTTACPQLLCKLLIERIEISYHNSRSTTIAQCRGGPTICGDNHICAGNGFIESFPWFERAARENDNVHIYLPEKK